MLLDGKRGVKWRCYHERRVCDRSGFSVRVVVLAGRRGGRVGFLPPCAAFFARVRMGTLERMRPSGGILAPVLFNL